MKKLRLLWLVGLMLGSFVFSCTLPMEVIEPKINGVKIGSSLNPYSVDEDDNIYLIDKNIIKKLDAKTNELTVIAGKGKPDEYPDDGNIDGDTTNAKFGSIFNIYFYKAEKSIYFQDVFDIKKEESLFNIVTTSKSFFRKVVNNKVETMPYNILFLGNLNEKFSLENNKLFLIDSNNKLFKFDVLYDYPIYKILDLDNKIYLSLIKKKNNISLYIIKNQKVRKIMSVDYREVDFSLDKKDNLYILESTLRYDMDGNKISGFYSPVRVHKITKDKILNVNSIIDLDKKEYFIGNLPENFIGGFVSYSGKVIYGSVSNSIYKVKIGE